MIGVSLLNCVHHSYKLCFKWQDVPVVSKNVRNELPEIIKNVIAQWMFSHLNQSFIGQKMIFKNRLGVSNKIHTKRTGGTHGVTAQSKAA